MSMRGEETVLINISLGEILKEATNVRYRQKTFEQEKMDVVVTFEGKTAGRECDGCGDKIL
jgi:hypothetical protein